MKVKIVYQNTKGNEDFALTPYLFLVWYKGSEITVSGIGICWGFSAISFTLVFGLPKDYKLPFFINYTNKKDNQA